MAQKIPLPLPDVLQFPEVAEKSVCLITDDGSALTPTLAAVLKKENQYPVILRFAGISDFTQKKRKALSAEIPLVELKTQEDSELQNALKIITDKHDNISGLIHIHPADFSGSLRLEEGANVFLKQAFLLAKNLSQNLTAPDVPDKPTESRRNYFIAVARLDGELGMGGETFGAVAGGLSGLIKTAGVEWSERNVRCGVFCRFVDLHPKMAAQKAAQYILRELHDPDLRIKEVGYNKNGRMTVAPKFVRDLATPNQPSGHRGSPGASGEQPVIISEKSVFLVSGGARGVTAECVIRLAETQPADFILLGRSSLEDEPEWARGCTDEALLKQKAMQALIASGEKPTPVSVKKIVGKIEAGRAVRKTLERIRNAGGGQAEYISADITDVEKLKSAIAPAVEKFGAVSGIIHGAGVLADKLLEKKTAADFDAVCSTKINGLDALLKSVNPDNLTHLILFSSAAGFYGNAGQADYAMANETLNRIALLFRQKHPDCHVASFNWGPWEGGMVTPELKRLFEERDVEVIAVEDGTRVFVEEITSAGQENPLVLIGNSMVVPHQPAAASRNCRNVRCGRISRKIFSGANQLFQDHKIGKIPVLPAVHAMAWMADVCEQVLPGFQFSVCRNFKVLNGVKFDETLADEYTLELKEGGRQSGTSGEGGDFSEIEVKISSNSGSSALSGKLPRYHYSTQIRLVRQIPEAPLHDRIDLSKPHNLPGTGFYQDRTLFHGPKFQGIAQVLNIGEQGLTLECNLPKISLSEQGQFPVGSFNPFAADLAFQAMLIWAWRFQSSGSLPLKTEMLEHFRFVPFETPFYLSMSVNKSSATALNADLFLHDKQGVLYARMLGAEVTLSRSLNALFGKTGSSRNS